MKKKIATAASACIAGAGNAVPSGAAGWKKRFAHAPPSSMKTMKKSLAHTFRGKILGDDAKKLPTIDKRQRREVAEKRNAEITMQ